MTLPARRRKAARLRARGRQLATERRLAWQRGSLSVDESESYRELARVAADPEERRELERCAELSAKNAERLLHIAARTDRGRPTDLPPDVSQWHESRADGKVSLFQRVRACREEQRTLYLRCRDCGWEPPQKIAIGCSAQTFCPGCRQRAAQKFRVDFERKRLGLTSTARRAGLMGRYRRRSLGGRFGERLLTLTLPHWGAPAERVQVLKECWPRFWRLVGEKLRPRLASLAAGIRAVDAERFNERTGELIEFKRKGGRKAKAARAEGKLPRNELSLWDLVSYLWVLEWTPGDDGLGHPHLHVWLFSPWLDHAELQELWAQAFADVAGHRVELVGVVGSAKQREAFAVVVEDAAGDVRAAVPMVDVRSVYDVERHGGSVANEIVKYLTKEWESSGDGVKRAAPEVFAEVFTTIDGQRMRQSSSGLSRWAIPKVAFCPCCGYENHRGHWAWVAVQWKCAETLRRAPAPEREDPNVPIVATGPPSGAESREQELRREYWEQRDAEWRESLELRVLRARWERVLAGGLFDGEAPASSDREHLLEVYERRQRGYRGAPMMWAANDGRYVVDAERVKAEREE